MANVVVDALSRKYVHAICTAMSRVRSLEEVEKMGISMIKKVPDNEEFKRKILTDGDPIEDMDRLTKSAHFIPMKDTWSKAELAKAYIKFGVKLHGVPKDIISDRESRSDAVVLGPKMIREMVEQVQVIGQKMRVAHDRQKSYADLKRSEIEFTMGDKVLLKPLPMKGLARFGKRGKLSQKCIGPYEILDRVGEVAYRLALLPALNKIYNVFHVFELRKYVSDPTYVFEPEHV
ncbi:uncharacterized protein LOC141629548 [Silene latifolia]|uniref:uncharacterized protein LOC141629548 n=1 Tax=Silene latifolia TaxID=37657 RepID=UPI003D7888E4